MSLLQEQGIPMKYKEIGVIPNLNCDCRVINPKGCIQDCIGKCYLILHMTSYVKKNETVRNT